jgi:hypothetical protein
MNNPFWTISRTKICLNCLKSKLWSKKSPQSSNSWTYKLKKGSSSSKKSRNSNPISAKNLRFLIKTSRKGPTRAKLSKSKQRRDSQIHFRNSKATFNTLINNSLKSSNYSTKFLKPTRSIYNFMKKTNCSSKMK